MRWEQRLLDLFEDLEQRAEGLALEQRDLDVDELTRAEYAEVDLRARLHASHGSGVVLDLGDAGEVKGVLRRSGDGWCLLQLGTTVPPGQDGAEALVRTAVVLAATGLSPRGVPLAARGLGSRLGVASAIRGLAEQPGSVRLHRVDGRVRSGQVGRVGADFLELVEDGLTRVVPFTALAVVRSIVG